MPNILAFAGSTRKGSYNAKLVKIAAEGAQKAGANVNLIDLSKYPLPFMNQDLEAESGLPENARKLKQLFKESDGFIIASPEYNSAFSSILKNTLDWISRTESEDEVELIAFKDKTAVIMAASTGYLGGLRGLVFLRMLLANLGITVLATQLTISHAAKAFNDNGTLVKGQKQLSALELGERLFQALVDQHKN
ncbi:MAG: NAD(P)H-dependent oxidoreductase [Candidatus Cloacimonetes bacterium]|nr:NAD(P)H-dependent oxidoreductase [Candidatus Cloacimonadota bacterium]